MASEFYLGQLARISAEFKNLAGELADPSAVYVEIEDPGGPPHTSYQYGVDPEVVKDAVGKYHFDLDCNQVGWWHYRVYSTGTLQDAVESRLVVRDSRFD